MKVSEVGRREARRGGGGEGRQEGDEFIRKSLLWSPLEKDARKRLTLREARLPRRGKKARTPRGKKYVKKRHSDAPLRSVPAAQPAVTARPAAQPAVVGRRRDYGGVGVMPTQTSSSGRIRQYVDSISGVMSSTLTAPKMLSTYCLMRPEEDVCVG